ncbi:MULTISPECIES: LysR family transcriptional regulator substrate-binding protein [unclassified Nocardioides]|uniref:LysR family transcriptional regulator substrate-binding protein n=1 Tax=unclassified Nocardioides TaxID=2615069 RepID=UPI002405DCFE|nr:MULTISPECIES: LysR family transcriptional regulator substrate-binding protein [unclassified Nocardioides]
MLPEGHPAASGSVVRLEQLAEERWVDTLPGYANRVLLETALAGAGLERRLVVQAGDLPSVVAFVRAGTGVAVLPSIVPTHGCVTRPLADDVPPWRLSVVWRAGTPLTAAAAAFRDELVDRAAARRRPGVGENTRPVVAGGPGSLG